LYFSAFIFTYFFCNSRCSLFIVQGEVGTDSHCLVSDLFDVNVNSTVEEMNKKTEIRIPWGSGIVGYVASSGKSVNITDCYADERFNPVSLQLRVEQ
jgi:dual 3',5'-cyclic-AMP and -GMP phosphodiesterase 11